MIHNSALERSLEEATLKYTYYDALDRRGVPVILVRWVFISGRSLWS